MTKVKMGGIEEGIIKRNDNVAGLVDVDEWSGTSVLLNVELLIDAIGVFKKLSDAELIEIENIHIGIDEKGDKPAGVFYMFFDRSKKKAYAIAGKKEED